MKKTALIICLFLVIVSTNGFAGGKKEPVKKEEPVAEGPQREVTALDKIGALIKDGQFEEARTVYVHDGFMPNTVDADGRNTVHLAVEAQNAALADFFIRLGNVPDAPDNLRDTPLTISARNRDAASARILLAAGAYIHHPGSDGLSAAAIAVRDSSTAFLGAILTAASLLDIDEQARTILHLAVEEGNTQAVQLILAAGSIPVQQRLINMRTQDGKTALDLAYSHPDSLNHARVSQLLVDGGGISSDPLNTYFAPAVRTLNFNLRGSDGISSLHFSVREKRTGWTELLLEKRADVNIKNTAGTTPLHEAAMIGDIETMRRLIAAGADVNGQDGQGNTAMHLAVPAAVHQQALDLLLRNRANPNLRDGRGDSPLHVVISLHREAAIAGALLQGGSDVSIHNIEGKTPLFTAIEEKANDIIPLLLDYNSDIFAATNSGATPFERALSGGNGTLDALITERTVLQADNGGNTPLLVAVRLSAAVDTIRKILDKNALVNARNQEGDTALHIAVRLNAGATGELLLSRGADVFLQNAKGESPLYLTFYLQGGFRQWMFNPIVLSARDGTGNTILHWATQWGLDAAIPEIVSKGANLEAQNVTGETSLFIAVKADSASTVRALISAGASLAGRDTLGNSAIHAAVRWNAQAALGALITAGIDINAYNLYGMTPLHEAVRLGMFNSETALIRAGAMLELRDNAGNTPLMEAVMLGNLRSASNIVKAGGDSNARNNEGDTPLLVAVQSERSDLVGLLLDSGAQIHAQNAEGSSPFTAALHTSRRMMLTLLEKGRDQTDNEGRSPLHIALLNDVAQQDIEQIAAWVGRLSIVDREGRTPLRYAVNSKNWQAVRFLTDEGSNVFSTGRDGKTPAELTLVTNDREAVRALFGGRGITARDSQGNTVLHYAARLSQPETVSFLLELGADKNIRNTANESAADIASRWGRNENANILR
ncbi:MAG: ankyrin repeat domain-containing protein [Spirochaetaceae bacterium]|jgi:ankyrin repeat protein|nr:ankyrin repeat domain-containing protein [Spirochaetaceae bacterium]